VTIESTEERVKRRRGKSTMDYREITDSEFFSKAEAAPTSSSSPAPPSSSSSTPPPLTSTTGLDLRVSQSTNNLIMQLRKACNHPYVFRPPLPAGQSYPLDEDLVTSAGKLLLMDRLVPKLIEGGHKFLVFSQFTTMLDILEDYFALRNLT